MNSSTTKSILITKALILLGLMMALSNWDNSPFVYGQQPPAHTFQGKVTVNGRPAPDGTGVIVVIDGRRAVDRGALVKAGNFRLLVPQQAGMSFAGKTAVFRAKVPSGQQLKSDQTVVWEPGGKTRIDLNFGGGGQPRRPGVQIPGAPGLWDLECIARVLGRMPSGIKDTTDDERLRMTRECMVSGENQPGSRRQTNPPIQQTSQELQNARQELESWKQQKGQQVQQQIADLRGKLQQFKQSLNQPVEDKELELNKLRYQRKLDEFKQAQQECKTKPHLCRERELQMQVQQAKQNIERRERTVVEDGQRRLNNNERETESRIRSLESNFARELRQKEEEFGRLERGLREQNAEQRRQSDQQRQRQQEQQRRQADYERQSKMDEQRMEAERKRMDRQEQMRKEEMNRQTKMDEQRIQAERKRRDREEQMRKEEMNRQAKMDEQRMEAERKRIDRQEQMQRDSMERQRKMDEERMQSERNRRTGSLPGEGAPVTPFETEDKKSGRGFFSNNAVGGLGTANSKIDPTMLAIIGIVITLGATMLQMVKGG